MAGKAVADSSQGDTPFSNSPPNEVMVEFSVCDCGMGIALEQQAQLFQVFKQLDATSTRRFEGSGLGLSIVSRLAEQMNGSAGVESTVGKGSRFWFRVRLCLAEQTDIRQAPRDPTGVVPGHEATARSKVLVVEDNPINRVVAKAMLNKLGNDAVFAENGQEALDTLEHWQGPPPCLVLMDCHMPVLDGFAATEAIRRRELERESPRIHIVALTAAAFAEDRAKCLAAGMDEILTKPIDLETLAATLQRVGAASISRSA